MKPTERAGIRDRIEALRDAFEAHTIARRNASFPTLAAKPLTVEVLYGLKYARIVRVDLQSCVAGFVDLQTGDILYPASWRQPAKHARGNVFASDYGLSAFGDYAVRTLR